MNTWYQLLTLIGTTKLTGVTKLTPSRQSREAREAQERREGKGEENGVRSSGPRRPHLSINLVGNVERVLGRRRRGLDELILHEVIDIDLPIKDRGRGSKRESCHREDIRIHHPPPRPESGHLHATPVDQP
jgi:hypothetical protein